MKTHLLRIAAFALTLIAPAALFAQGSLTPPGAPAPGMKTLQQIEPRIDVQNAPASAVDTSNPSYHYIINQAGSYYLSANLAVTRTNGIQINSEGVTLDLHGFEISRATGTGGNGIDIPGVAHGATILNGSVKGFGYGIRGNVAPSPEACTIRNFAAINCTAYGISLGSGAVVESCRVYGGSGSIGFYIGASATLRGCTVMQQEGSYAIRAGAGSSLTHCAVGESTVDYGFYLGGDTAISNCSVAEITGTYGILVGIGSSVTNCAVSDNTLTYAFWAGTGSSLSDCAAAYNESDAAQSAAFATATGCKLSNCTAYRTSSTNAASTSSSGVGFQLDSHNFIQSCVATYNEGDGIRMASDSMARDNHCQNNGYLSGDGAGIHVGGGDCRIEGNNLSDNDRGLDVDAAGNVIIKNSASGNTTNYVIAANNVFGEIVDRRAPASAAVNGNSAASSASTTDPWANFSY